MIAVLLKFDSMCPATDYVMLLFLHVAVAWFKYEELALKNLLFHLHSNQHKTMPGVKQLFSFVTTITLKFYSPPCAEPQIAWCRFFKVTNKHVGSDSFEINVNSNRIETTLNNRYLGVIVKNWHGKKISNDYVVLRAVESESRSRKDFQPVESESEW